MKKQTKAKAAAAENAFTGAAAWMRDVARLNETTDSDRIGIYIHSAEMAVTEGIRALEELKSKLEEANAVKVRADTPTKG